MISLYSIYPPLAPLGETREAKVDVSGKVGRDRTPPLFEARIIHMEMFAAAGPRCCTNVIISGLGNVIISAF